MTHEELLANIDYYLPPTEKLTGDSRIRNSALGFMNALRAIVELHKPKMYEGRVSNYFICTGCYEEEGQNYDYPCPTIQAIEKELR